jgi:hypothetical protein
VLTRKQAIFALLSIPLGSFRSVAYAGKMETEPAQLTINLSEWAGIRVTFGKAATTLTPREIFEALTS